MPEVGASIFIVEDESSVRNSLVQVFTALGYRARGAADGLAALIAMRQEVPDILLSDLNMPAMSGFELLSIVRRRFPDMHVIAMSGALYGEQIPCGVSADAFYQKGSGIPELLKTVESRPVPRHLSTPDPIWIQKNGCDPSGGEFVIIACPECCRTLPSPLMEPRT
ncbi:MAG TPA: response regulator [Terracidiphilus sp.]